MEAASGAIRALQSFLSADNFTQRRQQSQEDTDWVASATAFEEDVRQNQSLRDAGDQIIKFMPNAFRSYKSFAEYSAKTRELHQVYSLIDEASTLIPDPELRMKQVSFYKNLALTNPGQAAAQVTSIVEGEKSKAEIAQATEAWAANKGTLRSVPLSQAISMIHDMKGLKPTQQALLVGMISSEQNVASAESDRARLAASATATALRQQAAAALNSVPAEVRSAISNASSIAALYEIKSKYAEYPNVGNAVVAAVKARESELESIPQSIRVELENAFDPRSLMLLKSKYAEYPKVLTAIDAKIAAAKELSADDAKLITNAGSQADLDVIALQLPQTDAVKNALAAKAQQLKSAPIAPEVQAAFASATTTQEKLGIVLAAEAEGLPAAPQLRKYYENEKAALDEVKKETDAERAYRARTERNDAVFNAVIGPTGRYSVATSATIYQNNKDLLKALGVNTLEDFNQAMAEHDSNIKRHNILKKTTQRSNENAMTLYHPTLVSAGFVASDSEPNVAVLPSGPDGVEPLMGLSHTGMLLAKNSEIPFLAFPSGVHEGSKLTLQGGKYYLDGRDADGRDVALDNVIDLGLTRAKLKEAAQRALEYIKAHLGRHDTSILDTIQYARKELSRPAVHSEIEERAILADALESLYRVSLTIAEDLKK